MQNVYNSIQKDFNSHARVGRDLRVRITLAAQIYFNSHARVGRDKAALFSIQVSTISTHTPV